MAKISARNDRERARWRHPETGEELVLTEAGRLLHKWRRDEGFGLLYAFGHRGVGALERSAARAERGGMRRVP